MPHTDRDFGGLKHSRNTDWREPVKSYTITCEISGPTAMWTRLDTGDVPVSYPAQTDAAVKGIFESIVWWKSGTMPEVSR